MIPDDEEADKRKARKRDRNRREHLARKLRRDSVTLRLEKGCVERLDDACRATGLSRSAFVALHVVPMLDAMLPRSAAVEQARIARAQSLATFLGAAIDAALDQHGSDTPDASQVGDDYDALFASGPSGPTA